MDPRGLFHKSLAKMPAPISKSSPSLQSPKRNAFTEGGRVLRFRLCSGLPSIKITCNQLIPFIFWVFGESVFGWFLLNRPVGLSRAIPFLEGLSQPFQCFARLLSLRRSPSLREDITGLKRPSCSQRKTVIGIDPHRLTISLRVNSLRSVTAARCVASICDMYFPAGANSLIFHS